MISAVSRARARGLVMIRSGFTFNRESDFATSSISPRPEAVRVLFVSATINFWRFPASPWRKKYSSILSAHQPACIRILAGTAECIDRGQRPAPMRHDVDGTIWFFGRSEDRKWKAAFLYDGLLSSHIDDYLGNVRRVFRGSPEVLNNQRNDLTRSQVLFRD